MNDKFLPFAALLVCSCACVILFCRGALSQDATDDLRTAKSSEYAERLNKQIAQRRQRARSARWKTQAKPARYEPKANKDATVAEGVDVGVTFWRLRPAQKNDPKGNQEPTRRIVRRQGRTEEQVMMMVPVRAESETFFANGDLLRLSVEPPFESYIYIINREQYADGSYGEPYLVFPADVDVGRSDRGSPGRLLFLPGEDKDNVFEIVRLNSAGLEKVAEVFTVIFSQQPLKEISPLGQNEETRRIDQEQFERWQRDWGGTVWSFENRGSKGASITKNEKNAGAKIGQMLTEADPQPQTIYHVASKSKHVLLFDVALKIRK